MDTTFFVKGETTSTIYLKESGKLKLIQIAEIVKAYKELKAANIIDREKNISS